MENVAIKISDEQVRAYEKAGKNSLAYAQRIAKKAGVQAPIKKSKLMDCGRFYRIIVYWEA